MVHSAGRRTAQDHPAPPRSYLATRSIQATVIAAGAALAARWIPTSSGASCVAQLNDAQRHRGPDHTGLVMAGSCTNGQHPARNPGSLSGRQPTAHVRGQPAARRLKWGNLELPRLRCRFALSPTSISGGAVITPFWARFAHRSFGLLEGMWAIAIADLERQTVTLARNPFGIKPLFVRTFPDGSIAMGAGGPRSMVALPSTPDSFQAYVTNVRQPNSEPCPGADTV